MSCNDCPDNAVTAEPQRAVRFLARLNGGRVIEGHGPDDWRAIPGFPSLVLAVKLFFSDGTCRYVSGWSWSYLLECEDGRWTVDSGPDANMLLLKYPHAVFKPGGTVSDAEMQAVNDWLRSA